MDEKDKIIAELQVINAKLMARIAELEQIVERLRGLNSTNSSKSPASDGLRKKPVPTSLRIKGQRLSGGQVGHKGHTLKQVSEPDCVIVTSVNNCDFCKKSLKDIAPASYIKRQVFDIPEPRIEVTEYQAEVKMCTCSKKTTASFFSEISAPVQYGPRVKALAVYLSNQQFIPEERMQQTFHDLFDLPISTATLARIQRDFSKKVAGHQEQILQELKSSSFKHMDETGFRIGGKTQWLHSISNKGKTHYRSSPKRKNELIDVTGIVIHDHWKPYFSMQGVEHALCNAHHLRELKALEDIEKEPWARSMRRLLSVAGNMKDPPLDRIAALYDSIVEMGLSFHTSKPSLQGRKKRIGHNLLIRLRDYKDAVLRFLEIPGIPFTNNQAEQDLRMMKLKQKISGGFRTSEGADIFCNIRGFISTNRKQGNHILTSIQAALS